MADDSKTIHANFIDGKATAAVSRDVFESINPTTGEVGGLFASSGAEDVDAAVRSAHQAFTGAWGSMSPTRRGRLLMRWGDKLAENADRIGRMETQQNGKLLAGMAAQVRAAQDWLYYFGGLAGKVQGDVIPLNRSRAPTSRGRSTTNSSSASSHAPRRSSSAIPSTRPLRWAPWRRAHSSTKTCGWLNARSQKARNSCTAEAGSRWSAGRTASSMRRPSFTMPGPVIP